MESLQGTSSSHSEPNEAQRKVNFSLQDVEESIRII
jgi:hypothetical protein